MPGQLTFPAAFSSPHRRLDVFIDMRGGTPQAPMCKSRQFLIALPAKWTRPISRILRRHRRAMRAAAFSVHIFTALGRGHRPDRAARGGARALGGDVCLAWRRLVIDGLDGPIARRLDVVRRAAELVGRSARSRGRFRHLCLRAGLCDHRQRPVAAAGGAAAGRGHRRIGRAVFCRSPHEDRGQSFPRLSGAVECRGVLSVPAASAAGACRASGSPS